MEMTSKDRNFGNSLSFLGAPLAQFLGILDQDNGVAYKKDRSLDIL